jgi:hypothetical protein
MAAPFPSNPQNRPIRLKLPQSRLPLSWVRVFYVILASIFCYLLGQVVLLARRIKKSPESSTLDAKERRRSVKSSALLSLLLYIPVLLFRTQIAHIWSFIFTFLARWLHHPLTTWIAQVAIWPPTLSTTLYRWLLALPLVYLLVYIFLITDEFVVKTRRESARIVLPEELEQLLTSDTKQKAATKRPHRSAPTSITNNQKSLFLWEQIDWSLVPEDNPLKKAVIEEAERNALEQYSQRIQIEVQQALQRQQIKLNTQDQ